MVDTSIKRCEADSPNRCQATNARGDQCMNEGLIISEGVYARYCSMHGGVTEVAKVAEGNKSQYRLAKWQSRISDFASNSQVKGLRDEIGILRMVLEEHLSKCQDTNDLLLSSNIVSDLVLKIEKVVTSCHKLESSMGQLLDRQQIIQLAESIIGVIGTHVKDPAVLALLANDIGRVTEAQIMSAEKAKDG